VLAVGDLQESDGLVGHSPHGPVQGPFPPAPFAALRAWGLLGGAVDRYNDRRGCFGAHGLHLRWWGLTTPSFTGMQALSFKCKTTWNPSSVGGDSRGVSKLPTHGREPNR